MTIAVAESLTVSAVLRTLGLKCTGANHVTVHDAVKRLGLSTVHMLGQSWGRGIKRAPSFKRSLDEILVDNSPHRNSCELRRRLVSDGLLAPECAICGIVEWLGSPLSIHLDHENGDRSDNRLENLRSLCPNCHSQTDTFGGRNTKAGKEKRIARLDKR